VGPGVYSIETPEDVIQFSYTDATNPLVNSDKELQLLDGIINGGCHVETGFTSTVAEVYVSGVVIGALELIYVCDSHYSECGLPWELMVKANVGEDGDF
jgi:hypothetical protein